MFVIPNVGNAEDAATSPASPDAKADQNALPMPTTVAAVVDFQRLMSDAKAAKDINDQVEARRKSYLDELSAEEQHLYDTDKEIARQRSVLAPEVYTQKRRDFEQRVQQAQRLSQERRQQLEAVRARALGTVRQAVIEVVDELAKQRGFNLVLPSSTVLLFAPDLDLTQDVLAILDKKLPHVEVPDTAN
ncbi:periplasmic chaperone for outer membrane proteins Skp [Arboricoccus pini]|uniref:Periplasmic chaperone for outer membrane proteins Skp n=2 Tax=Arboricoccus pini TaxID=1963835 RepID=A0A212R7B5_9PROT|nr:periplasmic chaperone for outer membrane proteins Skp [Arboricoccus pini]